MTNRRILDYIAAEPFQPFRIKMTSGEVFDIDYPELISVGRTTARVFCWTDHDNGLSSVREQAISICEIESLELLKRTAPI